MIVSNIHVTKTRDARREAWAALSRFLNVNYTQRRLIINHLLGNENFRNANKQADQIRYCVIQAREYFEASEKTGLATRPLLQYYGVMSLALAQILYCSDGSASLDAARAKHAHHGLRLKQSENPAKLQNLSDSASALWAVLNAGPAGEPSGTFALWHRISREMPLSGKYSRRSANGTGTEQFVVMAAGRDEPMPSLPTSGISLLNCIRSLPWLISPSQMLGVSPSLVRGTMEAVDDERTNESISSMILHPANSVDLNEFYEKCMFEPRFLHQIDTLGIEVSGLIIHDKRMLGGDPCNVTYPNAFQISPNEMFFCIGDQSLNEFGLMYVALFILGNYARYFPDQWMKDIEGSSPLAQIAETIMEFTNVRGPLLTASVLSQMYILID